MFAFCTHQKNAGRIFLVQAWKHSSVIEKNFHYNNFKSRSITAAGFFFMNTRTARTDLQKQFRLRILCTLHKKNPLHKSFHRHNQTSHPAL